MGRLALVALVQQILPPIEQGEAAAGIAGFVGQIVGPAAVGVDVADMLPQPPRKEPAGDHEILVVPVGQPPAVSADFAQSQRLGGCVGAEAFEIVGEHALTWVAFYCETASGTLVILSAAKDLGEESPARGILRCAQDDR